MLLPVLILAFINMAAYHTHVAREHDRNAWPELHPDGARDGRPLAHGRLGRRLAQRIYPDADGYRSDTRPRAGRHDFVGDGIFAPRVSGVWLPTPVFNRDVPTIQGALFVVGVLYVVANVAVDILYGVVDPRIRY